MIIGQTGAGKSYFTNALLGCSDPSYCNFAATSPGAESCTENINSWTGQIYDGHYVKHGIDLNIRVFDTPGFGDADPDNLYKNKLLSGFLIESENNCLHAPCIVFVIPP